MQQPKIRIGLLVGTIGLVLNICIAGALGICGPAVSLASGAIAGFMAARKENPVTKGDGAKVGATSGAVAGALVLIGQMIGALLGLALIQYSDTPLPFGQVPPSPNGDITQQLIYYASGLGVGLCFGVFGIALAALAGAATGYVGAPESASPQITPNL